MDKNNSLVPATIAPVAMSTIDDVIRIGEVMAASGFFQDSRQAAQAVVKILAGQELGFGPFASMTGVFIIQGRPAVGANLMAAAVKRSGRFDYRVITLDDSGCEIAFYERGQEIGRSAFTRQDAQKAGTKNLDKFPRNMFFARAMSNGVRWYCPSVFAGAPVYTPEELGASVDEDGVIIDGDYTPTTPPQNAAKIVQQANDDLFPPQAPQNASTPSTDGKAGNVAVDPAWRERLAKNPRPTVGTVVSMVASACDYYQHDNHALNALNEGSEQKWVKADKLTGETALAMYDRLVERVVTKTADIDNLVDEMTSGVLDPFLDPEG